MQTDMHGHKTDTVTSQKRAYVLPLFLIYLFIYVFVY